MWKIKQVLTSKISKAGGTNITIETKWPTLFLTRGSVPLFQVTYTDKDLIVRKTKVIVMSGGNEGMEFFWQEPVHTQLVE